MLLALLVCWFAACSRAPQPPQSQVEQGAPPAKEANDKNDLVTRNVETGVGRMQNVELRAVLKHFASATGRPVYVDSNIRLNVRVLTKGLAQVAPGEEAEMIRKLESAFRTK